MLFIIRSKKETFFVGTCHIFNGASVFYPVAGPDAAAGSCRYGVSGHSGDRDFCSDRNGQLSYRKTPAMHFSLHFFIAYLFAKSMHIAVSIPDMRHIVCAVGSFLFMISDISILFLYFYKIRTGKSTCLTSPLIMWGFFFWRSVLCFIKRGRIFVEKCCIMFRRCQIMHIFVKKNKKTLFYVKIMYNS